MKASPGALLPVTAKRLPLQSKDIAGVISVKSKTRKNAQLCLPQGLITNIKTFHVVPGLPVVQLQVELENVAFLGKLLTLGVKCQDCTADDRD